MNYGTAQQLEYLKWIHLNVENKGSSSAPVPSGEMQSSRLDWNFELKNLICAQFLAIASNENAENFLDQNGNSTDAQSKWMENEEFQFIVPEMTEHRNNTRTQPVAVNVTKTLSKYEFWNWISFVRRPMEIPCDIMWFWCQQLNTVAARRPQSSDGK